MRVYSFSQDGNKMRPVEVELSLIPGLPQVQFTGLPDMAIKESVMRIKSAIREQGFDWPKTKQIIINLRPAFFKKSSQGLDLAIACALLWKTKQISIPLEMGSSFYIYGELSLEGFVSTPSDWERLPFQKEGILTGFIEKPNYVSLLYQVSCLKDLEKPIPKPVISIKKILQKPSLPEIFFSKTASRILSVVATGEHPILLAGEAGSGKSTLLEHLWHLLLPPSLETFRTARYIWSLNGEDLKWRPFVRPHHSTTSLAMIGGGYPVFYGEITKAHGGILFMDEYLEFNSKVQEALREPIEKGEISISRKGQREKYPAQFLLVAATNLCPCGDLVPGKSQNCSYSLRRCFSHLERLNGPMLDRFDVLAFSSQWKTGDLSISLESIYKKVMGAYFFRQKRKQIKANSQLSLKELESSYDCVLKQTLLSSNVSSKRRYKAILKVSRSLADLEESLEIKAHHIEQAKEFSFTPFVQMKNKGIFP